MNYDYAKKKFFNKVDPSVPRSNNNKVDAHALKKGFQEHVAALLGKFTDIEHVVRLLSCGSYCAHCLDA